MTSAATERFTTIDLEAVAWLYGEVEQVLTQTQKTLRSRLRVLTGERKASSGTEQSALTDLQNRLEQSIKALGMVNVPGAVQMLAGIAGAVKYISMRPEALSEESANTIDHACFALLDFLQHILKGKTVQPIGLFMQYNDVVAIAKQDALPADLWDYELVLTDVKLPEKTHTDLEQEGALSRLNVFMLSLLRGKLEAALDFKIISLGLAYTTQEQHKKQFWSLVAGFFDGIASKAIALDLYTKRAASHVLKIHKAYTQGELETSPEFAKNLLFFCANAKVGFDEAFPPVLTAVIKSYGLEDFQWVNYAEPMYGKVDPALISLAQKRISTAKGVWSSFSSGEPIQAQSIVTSISNVTELLNKIIPDSRNLSDILLATVLQQAQSNKAPSPEMALEVATTILYLEAIFNNIDLDSAAFKPRLDSLTKRLENMAQNGKPLPLDAWIEDLYQHINDHETMESVVGELHAMLNKVEKQIDGFLRKDESSPILSQAIAGMQQMYGVLSVLGLDEAAHAMAAMKDQVQWLLQNASNTNENLQADRAQIINTLSNSLGAFGFLVNMLGHQPLIARELFAFDEEKQELVLLMGRNQKQETAQQKTDASADIIEGGLESFDASRMEEAVTQVLSDTVINGDDQEFVDSLEQLDNDPESDVDGEDGSSFADDLRDIFLEEAHEVIEMARGDLKVLEQTPASRDALIAVRRGFHTLKGSSRMVGLMEFGEATWASEQCLNEWLTVDHPVSGALLDFSEWALGELGAWATDLQAGKDENKSVASFESHAKAAMPLATAATSKASAPVNNLKEAQSELSIEIEPASAIAQSAQQSEAGYDFSGIDLSLFAETATLEDDEPTLESEFDLESSFNLDDEPTQPLSHANAETATLAETEDGDVITLELSSIPDEDIDHLFPATKMLPDDEPENTIEVIEPSGFKEELKLDDEKSVQLDPSESVVLLDEEPALESLETTVNNIKTIGTLSVDKDLYAIYVDEALDRADKLKHALLNWQAVGDLGALENAQILAHAMAGSSFTVGFNELANLAKNLEHSIEHYCVSLDEDRIPADRSVTIILWKTGEEIHRLLHLFTEGTLASPRAEITEPLAQFVKLDFDNEQGIDTVSPEEADDIIDMPDSEMTDDELDAVEVLDQDGTDTPNTMMSSIYPETLLDSVYPEEKNADTIHSKEKALPIKIRPATESALTQLYPDDLEAVGSELFDFFKEEAQELLPRISEVLRKWAAKPAEKIHALEVLRSLHTLKGSARLTGAMRLGNMTHELEAKLESINSHENITAQQIQEFLFQADDLESEFELLCTAAQEFELGLVNLDDLPPSTQEPLKPAYTEAVSEATLEEKQDSTPESEQSTIITAPVTQSDQPAIYSLAASDRGTISSDLFTIFKDEAIDLLAQIGKGLREWCVHKGKLALSNEAQRALHTLKGSARLTGTMRLGSMTHDLESALKSLGVAQQHSEEEINSIEDQFIKIENEFELLSKAAKEVGKGVATVLTKNVPQTLSIEESVLESSAIKHPSTAFMALDPLDRAVVSSDVFISFNEEANRQITIIAEKLNQWQQQADSGIVLVEVLRALNVLRDNISLAGISRLSGIVQEFDGALRILIGTPLIHEQIEYIHGLFSNIDFELKLLSTAAKEVQSAHRAKEQEEAFAKAQEQALQAQALADEEVAKAVKIASELAAITPTPTLSGQELMPRAVTPTTARPLTSTSSGQMLRVRATLIDELVTKSGEVSMIRGQLAGETRQLKDMLMTELSLNLERLRGQLRDIEIQAETQMTSRMDAARAEGQGFDPLEFDRYTRIQELTRIMAESVNDVGTVQKALMETTTAIEDGLAAQSRSAKDMQHTLLRARMIEFSSITERFHRVIRLTAKECEKNVKLTIEGAEIEVDRSVLDHVAPAFEHMLRNSVVHGIESPEKRIALGKDPVGEVKLVLSQEGNDVSIILSDDGAGLDLNKIRKKAESINLIESGSPISDYDLAQMIYKSGLTTTEQVTELAGRGIGLDMAYAEIAGLGGRTEVLTTPHEGTQFKLLLPLTTAVTQVALVNIGGKTFGIPVSMIESIQRFSSSDATDAIKHGKITHNDEVLPTYWLGGLLEVATKTSTIRKHRLQWLVLRSAGQKIIIAVDNVIGSQEVVIKNVGPQFAHLTGFSGLTVLSGGRIVMIYNPIALARVFGEKGKLSNILTLETDTLEPRSVFQQSGGGFAHSTYTPPVTPRSKKVMVVDDSLTVRRVTQRFLERAGFEVSLAKDGRDALEQLNKEIPAVILSDIEMPRMDGFEFVRQLRGRGETENLPVIMITSRIAQKHHDYAKELGVNHYLGKPYDEEELLTLVKQFVTQAPEATI